MKTHKTIGVDGENLVFLMSMPRSGSTLFSMMLGTHTKISCPPEPWILLFTAECFNLANIRTAPYGRNNAQIAALDFLHGLEYEKPGTIEKIIYSLPIGFGDQKNIEIVAREFVRNAYSAQLTLSGTKVFIDKTPRNYTVLPLIDKYYPLSKKIFLKRNPLDIALSYLSTWRVSINELVGENLSVNSRDFAEGLFTFSDYFYSPSPLKHVVAYEDLVSDCSSQLAEVCRFIGVDYQPSMLKYFENETIVKKFKDSAIGDPISSKKPTAVNSDSVGRGVTGLTESDLQSLVNILGGDVFRELGYSDVLNILNRMGIKVPDEQVARLRRRDIVAKLHSKSFVKHERKKLVGLQIESIIGELKESEADRARRGEQIETLTKMLKESEADRAARWTQIEKLTRMLEEQKAELRALFAYPSFRWMNRVVSWPEVKKLEERIGAPND